MKKKSGTERRRVQPDDLLVLGEAKLARLLSDQLGSLPSHRQAQWIRQHLPAGRGQPASKTLLAEIEQFCEQSRSGAFVSWVDENEWTDLDDEGEDAGEFQEWVERFTELMKEAMKLTASGRHGDAVKAYEMLLSLLKDAGETTDVLGNHRAPEDSVELDFATVIEAYTRSLVATRSDVQEVIAEALRVAVKYGYRGGFLGLARALDSRGRERLRARLSASAEAALRTAGRDSPPAVEGLIALARVAKNEPEVLALKERFASRNAVYLQEALAHHQKKKDWTAVARLAEIGVREFGNHGEFAKALVRAREALGDRTAGQEARIEHFLSEPGAAAFAELKRRSEALGNWRAIFERVLKDLASPSRSRWGGTGLRTRLLLAEGREREALDGMAGRRRPTDIDELKLVAKYAVARSSEGANLARLPKLGELQRRLKRDKEEPYDWLRLILQSPAASSRAEFATLAAVTYRHLVDLHLDSGKPSRAAPAGHYCAIVVELSRLVNEPGLWTDLLGYLRERHGRKRLIWTRLKSEGCPTE
jgi:hypothetical protein